MNLSSAVDREGYPILNSLSLSQILSKDIKIKKIIFFNFSDGGGTSASSGDERPRRRVIISPMVQPQLVASGRYLEEG